MEFELSEDQRLLTTSVSRYCASRVPLDKVRASIKSDSGNPEIWQGLVDLGLAGVMASESAGGANLTLLDAALVAEVLGYHVVPEHFFGATLSAIALQENAHSQRLARIVSGESLVGIGLTELASKREGAGLILQNDQYVSGKALFVRDYQVADTLLLCSQNGEVLWVEDKNAIQARTLVTIDRTRNHSEITCEKVPVTVLAKGDAGRALATQLLAAARVLIAADSLGAAQAMLDKAVAYSLERKQFNRIIGSFQAVKHLCAEMAASLEPCRALLWYAAHCHQTVPEDFVLTACHLKAHLAEVSRFVARTATEVHGGMGFTDLLGLHFWFKRIGLDRQLLGGPELVREEAAHLSGYCNASP